MKILQSKITGPKLVFPPILVINWVSSCLSFSLSASSAATYIFTAPTCTVTIISLEFQHFIVRFNKFSLLCGYCWKKGRGVKACPKTEWKQGDFLDNSNNNMKSWNGKYEPKVPLTTPYMLERRNGWIIFVIHLNLLNIFIHKL